MTSTKILIIGGGFAGAATAYQLARAGESNIIILEQEDLPGLHASGQNAAMIREVVPDPDVMKLARDGARFLRNLPGDWPSLIDYAQNGALLLVNNNSARDLEASATVAASLGIVCEWLTREQVIAKVPVLKNARFDKGLWCPEDGVVNPHGLLTGYLDGALSHGVKILTDHKVRKIDPKTGSSGPRKESSGFSVTTSQAIIQADIVVNASGAWTNQIGQLAGASPLPIVPNRRHLFQTVPDARVNPAWPFVWDVSNDYYFRPESGGLLLSPCDITPWEPGVPPSDPAVEIMLAEKMVKFVPELASIAIQKKWAGLRSLPGDGKFYIGWDKQIKNFFWVAGLGGHGVTSSAAIGSLAADLIIGKPRPDGAPFSPGRSGDA